MKPLLIALFSTLLIASCETAAKKEPADAPPATAAQVRLQAGVPDASGVVTLTSGLRYQVLASGPAGGKSPSIHDTVVVHYHGTLSDGSVFDSSYDRGQPATLDVSRVIPGWTEALQLMKPGDKWLLQIPQHLGYGSNGAPPKIPPFADLTFRVELIQVLGGF